MAGLSIIVALVTIIWVTTYTASFGWLLWRKKNHRGAVGVFVLAAAVVVVPLLVIWGISR